MSPAELGLALAGMPTAHDPRLLVGYETSDDAAVYEIADGLLLVCTVDFFTPVVDDPYLFGKIAVANALSDVYAMGATPVTALNIAAFPKKLGMALLGEIFRGGAEKAAEAGIVIAGGHTVDDPEPKYGLAVTGVVKRSDLRLNRGARPGDALILTKPLGVGVLTTALKNDDLSEADLAPAVAVMEQLNAAAARIMLRHECHAVTDITGFGFLGHLREMCAASGTGAVIAADAVPAFPAALELARAWKMPGGSVANMEYLQPHVTVDGPVDEGLVNVLYDAQTSGGLLLAVAPASVAPLLAELLPDYPWSRRVGEITAGGAIVIRP
ncbi:MAG: selenide, water dikinase SelD [Acidobacteria bacterium]|nr:selenide, water dikinase SelD [Acidobacteriota bacterium]HPB28052.1 selenide, water dikinase SelD [Acidobacteriota bacterium]